MANDMLINKSGLVVNSFRDAEGRGAYFPGSAGTSEGQFLFVLGCLDAYRATNRSAARVLARRTLLPILPVIYRGAAVPTYTLEIAQSGNIPTFAPHWLFNAKYPFTSAAVHLDRLFEFQNGVATIPAVTGEPFRQAFTARSADSALLWANPYSALSVGTAYKVVDVQVDAQGNATVQVDQPINGQAFIAYSTVSGPVIAVDQPFEAWPDWRTLDAGEIACAVDVFVWAHKTFQNAFELLNAPTWRNAALATAMQGLVAFDINDSRDWIKPTYAKNPFAQGSMFRYIDRNPAPSFASDSLGRLTVTAQAGAAPGEIQVGNASRNDVYQDQDTTQITIGAKFGTGTFTVKVFIDPSQTYNEAQRYSADVILSDSDLNPAEYTRGVRTINLSRFDFKNPAGDQLPAGTPVYTVGVEVRDSRAFILTVERIRQMPPNPTMYYPGAIPFTANFQGNPPRLIDWRGPVYMGYQSPQVWRTFANEALALQEQLTGQTFPPEFREMILAPYEARALVNVQLLADAQAQWTAQTGIDAVGPFAPVFYFNRSDAVQYGPPDTFGWEGPDPNTKWGGYQYRPLVELAELHGTGSSVAPGRAVARRFIDWLADDEVWLPIWPGSVDAFNDAMVSIVSFDAGATTTIPAGLPLGPPTDFPKGQPETNYFEPHMAALILRAVIYLSDSNPFNLTTTDRAVLNKCWAALRNSYTDSGLMEGTFTAGDQQADWFGFWHGEILTTLSKFLPFATTAGWLDAAAEATTFIDGMLLFAQANIEIENSPVTPTEPLDPSNPHPLPGYPDQAEDPQEPDPREFTVPMITNPVNWRNPVVEELSYSTEIVTSESGREQRSAMRQTARRSLTYQYVFLNNERQKLEATLRAFQNRPILVPHWHLAHPIVAAKAGSLVVQAEADVSWEGTFKGLYEPGTEVLISYLRRYFRAQVKFISGPFMLLTNPLGRDWPAGTMVMPAFPALASDTVSISHQTSTVSEGSIKFAVLPQDDGVHAQENTEQQVFVVPGLYAEERRQLINPPGDWSVRPSSSFEWDYIRVENRGGPIRSLTTAETGSRQYSVTWQFRNLEEMSRIRSILSSMFGRWRAAWLPSGQNDFILRGVTGSTVRVTSNSFTREPDRTGEGVARKPLLLEKTTAVCFHLHDGTIIAARVLAVLSPNIEATLTLDRLVPGVSVATVRRMSLMYRVRGASDTTSISWITNRVGRVTAQFVTVYDDY